MGGERSILLISLDVVVLCLTMTSLSTLVESKSCCLDGFGLNYTLPMLPECQELKHHTGTLLKTIPKLIPALPQEKAACPARRKNELDIPHGRRVCRLPDCDQNPCQNRGWCEETMISFKCHCDDGFEGKRCEYSVSSNARHGTTEEELQAADTEETSCTSDLGSTTTQGDNQGDELTTPMNPTSTADSVNSTTPSNTSVPTMTSETSTPMKSSTEIFETSTVETSLLSTSTSESSEKLSSIFTTPPPTTEITSTSMTSASIVASQSTLSTPAQNLSSSPTTLSTSESSSRLMASTSSEASQLASSTASMMGPTMFVTDEGSNKIFVAALSDLAFTEIPATEEPRDITYDLLDNKIYWTDTKAKRVYRADLNGENQQEVTNPRDKAPTGIAIAAYARTLYISYEDLKAIKTISLDGTLPGSDNEFLHDMNPSPKALVVDESQGYLYWTIVPAIQRKLLNGTGDIEWIFYNTDYKALNGLSIDFSRNVRRILFCDRDRKETFYKDMNCTEDLSQLSACKEWAFSDVDLTPHLLSPGDEELNDVSFFNGTLYWTKQNDPKGIGIMKDYDQSNRSYTIQSDNLFNKPYNLVIVP